MPKDYWGPCGESTPEGCLPILMKAKRRRVPFFIFLQPGFEDESGGERRRVQREQEPSAKKGEDPGRIDEETVVGEEGKRH